MTQRNPFCAENWIQNGILPYFAFDVISLKFKNDQERLWQYLENLIASTDAEVQSITDSAVLFEKWFGQSTIDSIRSAATECTKSTLQRKKAYDDNDKTYIQDWASTLLNQNTLMHKALGAHLVKVMMKYICSVKLGAHTRPTVNLTTASDVHLRPSDRFSKTLSEPGITHFKAFASCMAHTEPVGYVLNSAILY